MVHDAATRMQILLNKNHELRAQSDSRAATQVTIDELLRDKLQEHIREQARERLELSTLHHLGDWHGYRL